MNIEQLKSLQERIRSSTGADRELDAEICVALRYGPHPVLHSFAFKYPVWRACAGGRVDVVHALDGALVGHFKSPELTLIPDGLGACVGLMNAVLPGWVRKTDATAPSAYVEVTLWPSENASFRERRFGRHARETHAHLLAIISALIAKLEAATSEDLLEDAIDRGETTL